MNRHVVPSIIASLVATSATVGLLHFVLPPVVTQVVTAPAGSVSPAKAARIARTVWPELSQAQIDRMSSALGLIKKVPVTIFCLDDAKCGDLVLNLDNAFEGMHWETTLQNSPMVPPGIISSSPDLVSWLNAAAPELHAKLDVENRNSGPGEYIAIGARP